MSAPTLSEVLAPEARVTWTNKHRGITYEVVYWGHGQGTVDGMAGHWNFYLVLPEAQWRPDDFGKLLAPRKDWQMTPTSPVHVAWDYGASAVADLDWAGGVTFYEVLRESPHRAIRAGCDYNHLWNDEMRDWGSYNGVHHDARRCVDSLLERFTPLVRCHYSGVYAPAEDMVPTKWPDKFVLASRKGEIWPQWFADGAA